MSMSVRSDDASRWSGPARSASAGCSPPGATRCVRRTSGCWWRSRGSTGWRGGCWRERRRLADADETLASFLERGRFSPLFRTHFMESLVACVWSCDPAVALDYPARYLFTFLQHHGMLQVFGSPQWRTVTGGSSEYVARVAARLPDVRTGTKVTSVLETPTGVEVTDGNGQVDTFDAVVVATHPGQALALLAEPTRPSVTSSRRCPSRATPRSCTPTRACCPGTSGPGRRGTTCAVRTTRPQRDRQLRHDPPDAPADPCGRSPLHRDARRPGPRGPCPGHRHDGVRAPDLHALLRRGPAPAARVRHRPDRLRRRLARLGIPRGRRPLGRRGGGEAGRRLGRAPAPLPVEATTYATTIRHIRRKPFRVPSPTARAPGWSTSTTCPTTVSSAGSRHVTTSATRAATIKSNVEHFLALNGVQPDGGRIVMAANARALGHCFNPISVFWCHRRGGDLAGVVVEVHNTYGDRHAYLVHPDGQGRARTDKQMYVSPFHGTDGYYEIAVPASRCPAARLRDAAQRRRRGVHRLARRRADLHLATPQRTRCTARHPAHPRPRHLAVGAPSRDPHPPAPPTTGRRLSMTTTPSRPVTAWPGLHTFPPASRPTSPPGSPGSSSGRRYAGCR